MTEKVTDRACKIDQSTSKFRPANRDSRSDKGYRWSLQKAIGLVISQEHISEQTGMMEKVTSGARKNAIVLVISPEQKPKRPEKQHRLIVEDRANSGRNRGGEVKPIHRSIVPERDQNLNVAARGKQGQHRRSKIKQMYHYASQETLRYAQSSEESPQSFLQTPFP